MFIKWAGFNFQFPFQKCFCSTKKCYFQAKVWNWRCQSDQYLKTDAIDQCWVNTKSIVFSESQDHSDAKAEVPLISGYCLSVPLASPRAFCHIKLSILVTRSPTPTTTILFFRTSWTFFCHQHCLGPQISSLWGRALNPHTQHISLLAMNPPLFLYFTLFLFFFFFLLLFFYYYT